MIVGGASCSPLNRLGMSVSSASAICASLSILKEFRLIACASEVLSIPSLFASCSRVIPFSLQISLILNSVFAISDAKIIIFRIGANIFSVKYS